MGRPGLDKRLAQVVEGLRARAAEVMAADDRAGIGARLEEVRDDLLAARLRLVKRMRPIRGPRGARLVKDLLDQVALVDNVLALLAACYEEEVGVPWDREGAAAG